MAGSTDCIMSLSRWQKLIAARTLNAVLPGCDLSWSRVRSEARTSRAQASLHAHP